MENLILFAKTPAAAPLAWLRWPPLIILPCGAALLRGMLPPWAFMWLVAIAVFAGFKWWAFWRTISRGGNSTPAKLMAFLFLWPGMDADRFLDPKHTVAAPTTGLWLFALGKTTFGAALIWGVARLAGSGWGAGWIAMVGFMFFLHFGIFHLLALFWQRCGIDAQPLMRWPALATSLGDFWGKRWNAGFRDLAFGVFFSRLARLLPPRIAMLITFLVSGLIHECVVTFPAGAGYGLPTAYFMIQGTSMLLERSRVGARMRLRQKTLGRIFAIAIVTLPISALFPKPFVLRVMVPFFQVMKALP